MNKTNSNSPATTPAQYLADDLDFAKQVVAKALNESLEGEMTELLGRERQTLLGVAR